MGCVQRPWAKGQHQRKQTKLASWHHSGQRDRTYRAVIDNMYIDGVVEGKFENVCARILMNCMKNL